MSLSTIFRVRSDPGNLLDNSVTLAKVTQEIRDRLNQGELSNWNRILNGDGLINQREDITTAPVPLVNNVYHLDRWRGYASGAVGTIQRIESAASGSSLTYLDLQVTTGGSGRFGIMQKLEDFGHLSFGPVVISGLVRSNHPEARIGFYDGFTEQYTPPHSGSGLWEPLSLVFTVNSGISAGQFIAHISDPDGQATTINTGSYMQVCNLQLHVGEVVIPFQHRSLGVEVELCRRYYEVLSVWGANSYCGEVSSSNDGAIPIRYLQAKPVTPVITLPPAGLASGNIFMTTKHNAPSVIGTHSATTVTNLGFRLLSSGYTGLVPGEATLLNAVGVASILVDGEI